jgi:hypothetical protein
VVGLNGIPTDASPGFHGFCHGETPFSSMVIMRSVTSWRKSRFVDGEVGTDVVSLVTVDTVLFLLRAEFELQFLILETGTAKRIATDPVQESLDASIKLVCSPHIASNRKGQSRVAKRDTPKY